MEILGAFSFFTTLYLNAVLNRIRLEYLIPYYGMQTTNYFHTHCKFSIPSLADDLSLESE